MSISYIDTDNSGPFTKHTLSKLITSFLDPRPLSRNQTKPTASPSPLTIQPPQPRAPTTRNPTQTCRTPSRSQWGKYRECTRTGWMLQHCKLPEPADPHIWTKTDDVSMLAMCCRLLAKEKIEGRYPALERMGEALEVARKLYARPQVPVTEWKYERGGVRRHGELLYWRLVVELAVRVGELETAAGVLGMGLRADGFNVYCGSDVTEYLALPGIWDVLPLLAKRGKDANPFYIEEGDAEVLVKEVSRAIELRARDGRQWSLAPEKVGWEELLRRLSVAAWKVNRRWYRRNGVKCADDILFSPVTEEEIDAAEREFGELPADFKDMIRIANGFQGGWHLFSGGIAGNQYLTPGTEEDLYNVAVNFEDLGMKPDGLGSETILQLQPGNECDGFEHFIIPPRTWKENVVGGPVGEGAYQYCNSASWQPGVNAYESVREWVACCVEEAEGMAGMGEVVDSEDDEDEDEDEDDSGGDEDRESESE
ncbi:hypothetical protein LOCC1_G008518 [Lachnellula occidentalis]|uniref:Knr4/Smi1-like domain-containing protein n=1 Tax=Lachnellula occidentalis TaxID=215460 RepID=A0A8H8UCN8_9HELO|nr:hypothetical protein LOCC1_G008518 [Lachnellula occidentalis]